MNSNWIFGNCAGFKLAVFVRNAEEISGKARISFVRIVDIDKMHNRTIKPARTVKGRRKRHEYEPHSLCTGGQPLRLHQPCGQAALCLAVLAEPRHQGAGGRDRYPDLFPLQHRHRDDPPGRGIPQARRQAGGPVSAPGGDVLLGLQAGCLPSQRGLRPLRRGEPRHAQPLRPP